jgi:hypothetical protein
VYQSFDWFDMPTFRYDSQNQNPTPSPDTLSDGASSGILELNAGDALHFNCNITYTQARAAQEGAQQPGAPLRFANEAFTGEMCILFGTSTGGSISNSLGAGVGALPSFATVH